MGENYRRAPKQARSQDLVDAVVDAAARLLAEGGSTTTNHIAETAGVSIGSVYRYFGTKDQIYEAVAQRYVEQLEPVVNDALRQVVADPSPATIRDVLARSLRTENAVPGLGTALNRLRLRGVTIATLDAFERRLEDAWVEALTAGAPGQLAARTLSRAVMGTLRATLALSPRAMYSDAFATELVELIMGYLGGPSLEKVRGGAEGR
ncbi:MAG: TetR/AcrR family transcriptional regulator [Alphaproteobacteria bacterium]|nr:TetR/AcrR family transcriptional regulator [Alphaproteobacteria bacterium]